MPESTQSAGKKTPTQKVLERLEELSAENERLRADMDLLKKDHTSKPQKIAQGVQQRADEIVARSRTLRFATDRDGDPTDRKIETTYEPHVTVEAKPHNWAVKTRIDNAFDKKRIGQFRPKFITFYSEHADEHLAKADYEKWFNIPFNNKTQVLEPYVP